MADQDSIPPGLYRRERSPYWYFAGLVGGRRRRVSTRCTELSDAVQFRNRLLQAASIEKCAHLDGASDWSHVVQAELDNSTSWLRRMIKDVRSRAKRLGRAPIDPEDARTILLRSGGVCELTGLPFDLSGGRNPYAPSFDRIDCGAGYECYNVRVVLFAVNLAVSNWGDKVLHDICVGYVNRLASESRP